MKPIHFWTSHPCKNPRQWISWFALDESAFEMVYDPVSPTYLFGSEHIYLSRHQFRKFLSLLEPGRVSVYFSFEAVEPDLNLFDYAVVHDCRAEIMDRLGRCPVSVFNNFDSVYSDLLHGCYDPELALKTKSRFCSFLYSNAKAHQRRDWLFRTLSDYKRVDSLGPHLNNCNMKTSRSEKNWRQLAIEIKRPYKFDIAAENARYSGYTTEKIMSSFAANAIPIYWGNPDIAEEFNPDSFVNANGMTSEELIDKVRTIDGDDGLWCKMAAAPPMTERQIAKACEDYDSFRRWARHIFDIPAENATRRPEGTWASVYRTSFQNPLVRFFHNHNWTAMPAKIRTILSRHSK